PVQKEITAAGGCAASFPCDAAGPASITGAMAMVCEHLGPPDVFVYNAGAFQMGGILEITPEQFETAWRVNCLGGLLAAQQVAPGMIKRGHGTIIYTGATASLRGSARFSCLAVGKFGLRALAQSMARELGPQGVHVAHVIIDGGIDTPRVRQMRPNVDPST